MENERVARFLMGTQNLIALFGDLEQLNEDPADEQRPDEGKLETVRREGQGEVGRLTYDDWKVVEGKRD